MVKLLLGLIFTINLYGIATRKNHKALLFVSFISVYFIMGFNTFTFDYPGYELYYNSQFVNANFEPGFVALSKLLIFLGLDYQGFLQVYFLIGLMILAIATRGLGTNLHGVILLYSLTQLFMDTNEIRQFMAYCFFALALTDYSKNKSIMRYCVFLIAASLFQRSAIILLLFAFFSVEVRSRKNVLKGFFITIFSFCILVFLNGNKIPGLSSLMIAFGLFDKLVYFETSTRFGFVLFWAAYFSNILVVYLAKKKICNPCSRYSEIQKQYVTCLWEFLIFTAFAMPLCMINSEFLRYYRFSVFPVILTISMVINKNSFSNSKIFIIRLKPFDLCAFLYVIAYSFTFQHWRVVDEVLYNNLLDGLLK